MKIWLCGITQNRLKDIDEMTKDTYQFFDGLNFVDGYSDDGTYELLESRKKEGSIVRRKWTNDHDFQMNEFLRQGSMKNGDWFVCLDSPDRINPEWLKTMRSDIQEYEKKNIGGVSMGSKIYLVRYFDHLFYFQNPHWGLNGVVGNVLGFNIEEKENYVTSTRFDDPARSGLVHPAKYYYSYGRSNHCQLLYGQFGQNVVSHHEARRISFRYYCQEKLGLELNLNSLIEYMKKGEFTEAFINAVELEVNMKDIFRHSVLGKDFVTNIDKNRHNWSFRNYLLSGDEDQFNTDYVGPINSYLKQLGKPFEGPCFP